MGRAVFERSLQDPESLATVANAPGVEDVFFEEFGYVAGTVLEERGEELEQDGFTPPDDPAGEQWDEDDLPQRFPRLWAAFGAA
jgi:hypothetical protein